MTNTQSVENSLSLRSQRVVLPGTIQPASIRIRDGIICEIGAWENFDRQTRHLDFANEALMPGIVDIHAHINEPGRTEWEGFDSATRAAAAGGITTLIDMPLNSIPPTTTGAALASKIAAAQGQLWVDVGFYGGIVPDNRSALRELYQAGVIGFKCFLCDSGVAEFPAISESELRTAIEELNGLESWILVHAESAEILNAAMTKISNPEARQDYQSYLESRPDRAEYEAVQTVLRYCGKAQLRFHIVHLSSASALPLLAMAKQAGLSISAETCPHYLTFDAETIPPQATEFKCAPPIREAANRERLWQALGDGTIDAVASDHSPCTPSLKQRELGDFAQAWGGIASLQFTLPVVWTEALRRGFDLNHVVHWMSERPAELAGLKNKGAIVEGKAADLICFAPDAEFVVTAESILHRHKLTPYLGRTLKGVVQRTFVAGRLVYDRGQIVGQQQGQVTFAKRADSAG